MEKVRPLEKMPFRIKYAYCKILSLMLMTDREIDQLKLTELYRLMARIELSSIKRQGLLDYLWREKAALSELLEACYQGLNEQEKNVLRFSLYKDLLIIMKANYVEMPEEKALLEKLEAVLEIREEHKVFFEEELLADKQFYEAGDPCCCHEIIAKLGAKAVAIGIPLGVLYFTGYVKGLGPMGILAGLYGIGKRVNRRHSVLMGTLTILGMGLVTYQLGKWLAGYGDRKKEALKGLMMEKMTLLHRRAIGYLQKDIAYLEERIQEKHDQEGRLPLEEILISLRKALAVLENTAPTIV